MSKTRYILSLILLIIVINPVSAKKKWVNKTGKLPFQRVTAFNCVNDSVCFGITEVIGEIRIFKTNDRGNTWEVINLLDRTNDSIYQPLRCDILDEKNIYMTYVDGLLLQKSSDGGKTFESILFDSLYSTGVNNMQDIKMFNERIGVATTYNSITYTNDNWETYQSFIRPKHLSGIEAPTFFIDSTTVVVRKYLDNTDEFLKFDLNTKQWSEYNHTEIDLIAGYPKEMLEVDFINDTLGYACGLQFTGEGDQSKTVIWKTTNTGKDWEILLDKYIEPAFGISDLAFKDASHGMAVGSWGKVIETTDGGKTWFRHDIQDEMVGIGSKVTWAGDYPLFTATAKGYFRYETVTESSAALPTSEDISIYANNNALQVAIKDAKHKKYTLNIYSVSGTLLSNHIIRSGVGLVHEPIDISQLNTGVYFYTLSAIGKPVESGKFQVLR